MLTSEQVDQVFGALADAQADLQNPNKTKTAKVKGVSKAGKEYEMTYKYADIADVLTDARPVLAKHGLCVIQATGVEGGAVLIRTRIGHKSGQWVESEYPVAAINGDHQKMGAALTYSRRYALCALIGVAAEEDVDGEGAEDQHPPQRQAPKAQPQRAQRPEPRPAPPAENPVDRTAETIPAPNSEDPGDWEAWRKVLAKRIVLAKSAVDIGLIVKAHEASIEACDTLLPDTKTKIDGLVDERKAKLSAPEPIAEAA